ncbi:unnamed protein product (macronuclear) [Paramecium tetraurelia]|uniref:Uncharacterized protein n=1 Tax=Paramecium tetraurelia TaxID=5888 RepID=A0C7H9_PARTE|nr:uncharacterized protein GSPATT00035876001 [Paramecium tetraurelia]CAK66746.1 unnamed protein product [Paramecium tetraurelia]|eukprot:XP_001434143.1 hypothetical protein (macronuclear) [Paramecium tetraurelia strain d4-2]
MNRRSTEAVKNKLLKQGTGRRPIIHLEITTEENARFMEKLNNQNIQIEIKEKFSYTLMLSIQNIKQKRLYMNLKIKATFLYHETDRNLQVITCPNAKIRQLEIIYSKSN